jgi:hypothetical protein
MFVPEVPIGNQPLLNQTNPMAPVFENTLNLWNWPWDSHAETGEAENQHDTVDPSGMPADFYKTF